MSGTTKAILVTQLNPDLSGLRLADIALPDLGSQDVRVQMVAGALNYPDLLMTSGQYQFKPALPFIMGTEGAGVVEAVGAGVGAIKVGDKVIVGARSGCFAQHCVVGHDAVRPVPEGMSFEQGAGFTVGALTAYVALVKRGQLQSGDTILIHGASGGMGRAALDLAKHLGATVYATTSNPAKAAALKAAGARAVFDATDFRQSVKDVTDGKGVDVVYDPVGGHVFEQSARVMAWGGRLLVIGFTSASFGKIDSNMPLIKGYSIVGVRAGEYCRRHPNEAPGIYAAIDQLGSQGVMRPHIGQRYRLDDISAALKDMRDARITGKSIITLGDAP